MTNQDTLTFKKGDMILTKGAKADMAYMIMSGTVEVYLENGERILTLASLGIGDIFGEGALFGSEEYGANVVATSDVTLLPITKEDFQEQLDECDPKLRAIITMMLERMRRTNEALLKSETDEFMDITFA